MRDGIYRRETSYRDSFSRNPLTDIRQRRYSRSKYFIKYLSSLVESVKTRPSRHVEPSRSVRHCVRHKLERESRSASFDRRAAVMSSRSTGPAPPALATGVAKSNDITRTFVIASRARSLIFSPVAAGARVLSAISHTVSNAIRTTGS